MIPNEFLRANGNNWCFVPHQPCSRADITEYPESEETPKDLHSPAVHHTVSKLCSKPAQNSLCPSVKPMGGSACVSGAEESSVEQQGGIEHPTGLLDAGGDRTSVPKFGINVFQVPLEAVAFQLLPQLHSALDAVGRKYHRDTSMEMTRVRPNTPKREAERNPSEMHRQQTQEHQQLWFLSA